MTIPRKGSRRIVVDGIEYRWRIRQKPTYSQAAFGHTLNVAVEICENSNCTLVVDLSQAHPCNWIGDPSTPVTPSEVSDLIRNALDVGWKPTEKGSAFKISFEDLVGLKE